MTGLPHYQPEADELRQNEHIEWFKRFAAAYLRWSHFNMDRIVRDAVSRDRGAT